MDNLEILIPIMAILLGSLMFLIPIAAFSLRFAAKPMVEALSHWRQAQGGGEQLLVAKDRIAFLEQRMEALEEHVGRLDEARDFDRRLQQDTPPAHLPAGSPD